LSLELPGDLSFDFLLLLPECFCGGLAVVRAMASPRRPGSFSALRSCEPTLVLRLLERLPEVLLCSPFFPSTA
jgi:hypothetical protein